MESRGIDSVLEKLSRFKGTERFMNFRDKAKVAAEILEDSGRCDWDKYAQAWKNDPGAKEVIAFGRKFFSEWEIALEKLYSSKQKVDANDPNEHIQGRLIDVYRSLVAAELKLCRPRTETKVCHVGCGSMPASVMMWHKYTGCSIVGIDCDKEAVNQAKVAFENRYAQDPASFNRNKIEFIHADGGEMSYAQFDIVLLSSTVRGKSKIFQRLVETGSKASIVLERVPMRFWSELADWEPFQSSDFEVAETVQQGVLELRKLIRR